MGPSFARITANSSQVSRSPVSAYGPDTTGDSRYDFHHQPILKRGHDFSKLPRTDVRPHSCSQPPWGEACCPYPPVDCLWWLLETSSRKFTSFQDGRPPMAQECPLPPSPLHPACGEGDLAVTGRSEWLPQCVLCLGTPTGIQWTTCPQTRVHECCTAVTNQPVHCHSLCEIRGIHEEVRLNLDAFIKMPLFLEARFSTFLN